MKLLTMFLMTIGAAACLCYGEVNSAATLWVGIAILDFMPDKIK